MRYSKTTGGFYDAAIHGDNNPADAVEITATWHAELLQGQAAGQRIIPDADGSPILADPLPLTKDQLCAAIDAEADAARLAVVGDPLRMVEYERAAVEATAYRAAGYSGTVPAAVQSWADAKAWTPQQATDDILVAAAAFNGALYALRDIRLKGKEAVRTAADEAVAAPLAAAAIARIHTAIPGL